MISLQSKGLSRVFSNTTVQKDQSMTVYNKVIVKTHVTNVWLPRGKGGDELGDWDGHIYRYIHYV